MSLSSRPEAYDSPDPDSEEPSRYEIGQTLDSGKGSPEHNSGFFQDAILSAKESEASTGSEIKVIANGHCHITDRCRGGELITRLSLCCCSLMNLLVHGVWMCFGGGGSYSGYGKIG